MKEREVKASEGIQVNIAIVDDEPIIRQRVHQFIHKYMNHTLFDYTIREFKNGEELLVDEKYYHLIFLDIDMPGRNGIEVASKCRERGQDGLIIFLTGLDALSKEGYKVNAFRYIGKSEGDAAISEAIRSACKILEGQKKILVTKKRGETLPIKISDILYFEASGRGSKIYTQKESFEITKQIGLLGKELEHYGFYSVHRAYLVNLSHVNYSDKKIVQLDSSHKVPLSEKKSLEFRKVFVNWRYERSNA